MKTHRLHRDVKSATRRARARSLLSGIIAGAARSFDILGASARPIEELTPEDDARNLRGDLERIGQDFSHVLARLPTPHEK